MGCVASSDNPASDFEYKHGEQGAFFEDACEAALDEDQKTGSFALKKARGDADAAEVLADGVEAIIGCEKKATPDGGTEYTIEWFYKGAKDSSCIKVNSPCSCPLDGGSSMSYPVFLPSSIRLKCPRTEQSQGGRCRAAIGRTGIT
jgi:hypothetical protein